jgi:hypothetical protein
MRRSLALILISSLALGAAAAATASGGCGDDASSEPIAYLAATPAIKSQLLAAYLRHHPKLSRAEVTGPLPGHTFYGSDGYEFAVAQFAVSGHTTKPVIFTGEHGMNWELFAQTHGGICSPGVPKALIVGVWHMRLWGGSCYVES